MVSKTEIKHINALTIKKYRQQYRQYFIEGTRLVKTALEALAPIDEVYVTSDFLDNPEQRVLLEKLAACGHEIKTTTSDQFQTLSDTIHPSGILAVLPLPQPGPPSAGPCLYLDQIKDPGNLGTLLRSTAWFGIKQVGLSSGCVDPWNPKVVRAGMGAHFFLDLYPGLELPDLKAAGNLILGANMDGVPAEMIALPQNGQWALALGTEAHGLSTQTQALVDYNVSIPRIGRGESLNVAVAGSILLSQLTTKPG